jgi:ElaB/YqjD/DUF883 family membrane-anchored ribosome-binding protein
MATAFSRFRSGIEDDLEAQVAQLTKELAALRKTAGKRGSAAYDDARGVAGDVYGDLRDRFVDALPLVRKQARVAERVARDNPALTAAVVGLAVAGLLVTMMARR